MTLKPRRFPSGPGFDCFLYGERVGFVVKQGNWCWQTDDQWMRTALCNHRKLIRVGGDACSKRRAIELLSAAVRAFR